MSPAMSHTPSGPRPACLRAAALSCVALVLVAACGGGSSGAEAGPPAAPPGWTWSLPSGFAPPVVPADNPMNTAKVELGRHLFYERRLSGNGTQACSSCHQQDKAFTDGSSLYVCSSCLDIVLYWVFMSLVAL